MRFSIVTVVKNGYPNINYTIQSVLNQNFKNYEYIILDGCSNDGTSELIKKFYKDKVIYQRKKDKGIYYALNRSSSKIKGDYVINLHAGDFFYSNSILKNLNNFIKKNKSYDFYTSNIVYYKNNEAVRLWRIPIKTIDRFSFLKIPHTSICIKKNLAKKLLYKTHYKISSDTNLLIDLCKSYSGKYINNFVIFMELGGISTSPKYFFLKFKEDLSILVKEFKFLFIFFWIHKILVKLPGLFNRKRIYTKKLLKEKNKFKNFSLK